MGGIEKAASATWLGRPVTAVHADLCDLAERTHQWLTQRAMLPGEAVVLVPYAQLMPLARQAWVERVAQGRACMLPQFVSTQQWATDMQALMPAHKSWGWSAQAPKAYLQARQMITQTGLAQALDGEATNALIETLMQAAQALAPRAQAMSAQDRERWLDEMREARVWGFQTRGFDATSESRSPQDALEPALLRMALEWVGLTSFDTDVLWHDEVRRMTPALVVWQGLQTEGLAQSLASHWGDAALLLPWPQAPQSQGRFTSCAANDAEEEACWAAACVLRHLQQGRSQIGVVALDRALVRRVRAMLAVRGVSVQDETGWKLSTTHAATQVASLLGAARHGASTHEVLDAALHLGLGNASAMKLLEQQLIEGRHFQWPRAGFFSREMDDPALAAAMQTGLQMEQWRESLQKRRSLLQWLTDVRGLCATSGLLAALEKDEAGLAVLAQLHLDDPQGFAVATPDLATDWLTLAEFSSWARTVLEAGSFVPEKVAVENGPRVSLIPLSQVLGRRWDALVLPGCDERHLPWCPPDNSPWTALQRQQLGLPGDEQKSRLQSLAWQQALAVPQLDVLRRKHEQGEECMASPLLRDTLHQLRALKLSLPEEAASPMAWLDIEVPTPEAPLPTWAQAQLQDAGLLKRITPSAYEDLRRCPYRFHARRLLGLSQDDELSEEADKRDWGNWLHRVLHRFHTQRRFDAPVSTQLDEAAAAVEAEMRLDGAAFLPFRMAWPSLREAYAKWLLLRDSAGDEFVRGEVDAKTRLPEADLLLQGRLDRVDRLQDGSTMIIDYKTESSSKTRDRVKEPQEDAQLAFYALLMQAQPSNLRAAYLNLPESGTTERGERGLPEIALHEMPDLQQHAQALREGIVRDVQRIRAGHALAPLGDGAVCDYCEVRGLCRRDYWKGA